MTFYSSFLELTGGTKILGSRSTYPNSKDISVINTTATLVIRQADDDDDDDEDESRREINDIPAVPESSHALDTECVSATYSMPSTSGLQNQQQHQQQQQGAVANHVANGNDASSSNNVQTATSSEENIPLAKRLKMN